MLGQAAVVHERVGRPGRGLARFYKVHVERIIVVHDELDLPFGTLRLKRGAARAATTACARSRPRWAARSSPACGSGSGARPDGRTRPTTCCASSRPSERKELAFLVDRAADAVEMIIGQGLEAAQNEYN